jgi:hypothetical protein
MKIRLFLVEVLTSFIVPSSTCTIVSAEGFSLISWAVNSQEESYLIHICTQEYKDENTEIGKNYYSLLSTTIHYNSLLFTTFHYYSLLFTAIHYYSLLFTTINFYSLLFTFKIALVSDLMEIFRVFIPAYRMIRRSRASWSFGLFTFQQCGITLFDLQ